MGGVHATAIVDPRARLGEGVEIGPFCVVGADVALDENVILHSHVVVEGHTSIGARCQIFPFASIGHRPQDLKYAGEPSELIIGSDNMLREHVTMNPGTEGGGMVTRVGDGGLFMVGAHVAHDCEIGSYVILSNSVNMAGHVVIEDWVIIGGLTAIHQFVRIGAHSFCGGGSRIPQDIPPYLRVAGNPAKLYGLNSVGFERRGISEEVRLALKKTYRTLFQSKLNLSMALEKAEEEVEQIPEVRHLLAFIRASERGITT